MGDFGVVIDSAPLSLFVRRLDFTLGAPAAAHQRRLLTQAAPIALYLSQDDSRTVCTAPIVK